jgi:hypothetical protein
VGIDYSVVAGGRGVFEAKLLDGLILENRRNFDGEVVALGKVTVWVVQNVGHKKVAWDLQAQREKEEVRSIDFQPW